MEIEEGLIFWTVNVKTEAGVESQVFTFAKTPMEAEEKVTKVFREEHAKFLEEYGEWARIHFGPVPLIKVTSVTWKNTFIP